MTRLLDLFSGIGGFSLGLERAGFKTVQFCEMKPHAQAVLAKNFPGIPCHEDVTTYDFREGEADAISAGFPCQDLSFAGDGAGLAGARSGLYREVVRAVRVVRPKVAVLENVAALLSRGLDVVLRDLAAVGYDAEWHCIPASAVGAPHRRDRIWIIADPRGEQHESRRPPFSGAIAEELLAANTDAAGERRGEAGQLRYVESPEWSPSVCEEMADAECIGQPGPRQPIYAGHPEAHGEGQASHALHGGFGSEWAVEPDVGRVAYGVPARMDRLAELGNAVVPKIPEIIGRAIVRTRSLSSQERHTP